MTLYVNAGFKRQPLRAVVVNRKNDFVRGLKFAWHAGADLTERRGRVLTPVNNPTIAYTALGVARYFTAASSQYIDCGAGSDVTFTGDMSVLVRYKLASVPATTFSLFARDADSGGRQFTCDISGVTNEGVRFYVNGGGAVNTNMVVEGRTPVAGDERTVLTVWSPSRNAAVMYVDGRRVPNQNGGQAVTNPPTATTAARIGARAYAGYQDYFNGSIQAVMAWERAFADGEALSICLNPWQIYAHPSSTRYFIFPVAAATFNPAWNVAANTVIHGGAVNA